MRKNVIRKWTVVVLSSMFVVALSGCGTGAKATDQEVADVSTATVAEESSIEDTSSEENTNAFAGAETDSIVLYSEIEEYGKYMPFTDQTFEPETNIVTAYQDIPIYNEMGVEVGYVKNGSTITLTESATEIYWARFENPIAGTDYDYLYMIKNYIVESQEIEATPSADDIRQLIIDEMNAREEGEEPTILETPDSDMEVYECRIPRESKPLALDYEIRHALYTDTFSIGNYMTYSLECVEDGNFVVCTIYYKDSYDEWIKNN